MGNYTFSPRKTLTQEIKEKSPSSEAGWYSSHKELYNYISDNFSQGKNTCSVTSPSWVVMPDSMGYVQGRIREVWGTAIEKSSYLTNQEMMDKYNGGKKFADGDDYLEKVYGINDYNGRPQNLCQLMLNHWGNTSDFSGQYKQLEYEIPYKLKDDCGLSHKAIPPNTDIFAEGSDYKITNDKMVKNDLCVPSPGCLAVWTDGKLSGSKDGFIAFIEGVTSSGIPTLSFSNKDGETSADKKWFATKSQNPLQFFGTEVEDAENRKSGSGKWFQCYIYPPMECNLASYRQFLECEAGQLNRFRVRNRMWVI